MSASSQSVPLSVSGSKDSLGESKSPGSSWKPGVQVPAVFCLASLILALLTANECQSILHWPSLMYGLVLWCWWGCISVFFWLLCKKDDAAFRMSAQTLVVHFLLACVLGLLHLLVLGSLGFTATGWQLHATATAVVTSLLNLNRFGIEFLIYGFVFGINMVMQVQIEAQRDAINALELKRQLAAAHLRALQMQLEPHFLFNTLNAITTLVELGRQREASETLAHLNTILKSTLNRSAPEKVPLSEELELVENYLAIEQIRFSDNLRVEMNVEASALDSLVPRFLLQPIVENAIRHGIAEYETDGLIKASVIREGGQLRLEIRDTGSRHRRKSVPGNGIGLRNTRERLAYFYPNAYAMKAEPIDEGGFEVAITFPFERASA